MRHSILITAYTDFFHLIDLANSFDGHFDIYIHLDKNIYVSETCINILKSIPSVKKVGQIYHINWGGRNHVAAILWLCHQALEGSADTGYFHLISGTDLLVRHPTQFRDFFEKNNGSNFLNYFSLPYKGWEYGGLNRLRFKHPLDRLDIKSNGDNAIYERYIYWQARHRYLRPLPEFPVYGGSTWWSLTREAIAYICNNYNSKDWFDRLEDTFVPEEMYIQTLLLNSDYKSTIINDNLRYIVWEHRNGNCPAVLDETDIAPIMDSNAIFARKVESHKSGKLISFFKNKRFTEK